MDTGQEPSEHQISMTLRTRLASVASLRISFFYIIQPDAVSSGSVSRTKSYQRVFSRSPLSDESSKVVQIVAVKHNALSLSLIPVGCDIRVNLAFLA